MQQHPGRAGAICRAVQDGAGDAPLFSRRNIAILAAGSSVVAGNAAGTALIGFTAPVLAAWTGVIGTACLAAITVSAAHIALNKYTKRLMQEDMDNVRKVYLENVLNPQGVTPPAGWIAEPAAPAVPVSGPDEEPTHPIRLTPAVDIVFPYWPRDLYPVNVKGDPLPTRGVIHGAAGCDSTFGKGRTGDPPALAR